ncbi:MAG: TonB-dependent receptor [Deltaproteobacteria bacterium]|nr:TonB-dependent receptor [Deltaproteobacteria bacterium]
MTGGIRNRVCLGIGLVTVITWAVPGTIWAQAAKGKRGAVPGLGTEIEEITVVAQKREESIQEVPISVTALTSENLAARGVKSITDIGEAAPNVRITIGGGTASGTVVGIRGIASANPNLSFEPAAGLYVDGVYIPKLQGTNLDLEDLDHVEVLRGPQGTLYGRNTIGGAINFITRKPTEERSVTLQTEAGNYETFRSRLTFNLPLIGKNGFWQSDALGTLSLRETVMYKHHDGYFTNQSPTSVPASGSAGFASLNRIFTMTSLRWQPIKPLTVDYAFEYHRMRNSPWSYQLTFIYPNSPASAGRPFDLTPYLRRNRVDSWGNNVSCVDATDPTNCSRLYDDGNHRMHILTGAYDLGQVGPLGQVTLKSISSYRSLFQDIRQDIDGSPLHGAEFGSDNNIKHWSEELQLVGSAPRVHFVLGGYYYGEHADMFQGQSFMNRATVLPYYVNVKTESLAPYGQVTVTPPILHDRLSVTAGIRYTHDQVHMDKTFNCVQVTAGGRNLCNLGISPALNNWKSSRGKGFGIHGTGAPGLSPMANIAYQATDDLMAYFRIARGYKSGGFNGTTNDPRAFAIPFAPERLLQYELGFKSQWLNNRLRVNAAGYYSDYKDLQQSIFRASSTGGVLSLLSNVDSAEVWGSEVEVTAIPVRGVDVTATFGVTLPKFLEWLDQKFDANNQPIFDPSGNPVLENVASQRSFGFTPQYQAGLDLGYTAPPTGSGTFSAHLDVFWQDQQTFLSNDNTPGAQAMKAPNYAVVNGRLQFVDIPLQKGSLDLSVFGRNLFDKKYRIAGVDFGQTIGWSTNFYGAPRTFGLQLTYNLTAGAEPIAPPPAPVAQVPPPPAPAKKKIVLRSVHFDFDKATLKAEAKPILNEAVQVLKQEGSVDIVVEGHTDSVGTEQYNLGLSRRRADTVRRYLVEHGVAPARITAEGMGESKPVASNDTADGRAQNRRVELHVK